MIETGSKAPEQIQTDVCIVGSGPAGMTVALELERLGVDCVLLESGNEQPDQAHTALNKTRQTGIKTDQNTVNRLRGLGGTSAHWGGLVRPLDTMDFERRSWVPDSGWPVTEETLSAYYEVAHRVLSLPAPDYSLAESRQALNDRAFDNVVFYHDKTPLRLGEHYRDHLKSSTKIRTYVDATVLEIHDSPAGKRVNSLTVSTLQGRRFTVKARHVVLAAGAIQTARLLLNANGVDKNGLGNQHDQVGRYFLQHPVFYGPRLMLFNPASRNVLRRGGTGIQAIRTAISPDAARENGLLNSHVFPLRQQPPGRREQILRRLPASLRHLVEGTSLAQVGDVGVVPEYMQDLQSLIDPQSAPQTLYTPLEFRAEQAPNPQSRITLGKERDALGMRQAVMEWRLSPLDAASARQTMKLLGSCVARQGLGRLQAAEEQLAVPKAGGRFLHGGNHHYGTTRMGDSPKNSVVDRDCRVHGLENLFVAGSAVFPTTGHANPTLTIVALAARLAQRLARATIAR